MKPYLAVPQAYGKGRNTISSLAGWTSGAGNVPRRQKPWTLAAPSVSRHSSPPALSFFAVLDLRTVALSSKAEGRGMQRVTAAAVPAPNPCVCVSPLCAPTQLRNGNSGDKSLHCIYPSRWRSNPSNRSRVQPQTRHGVCERGGDRPESCINVCLGEDQIR